MSLLFAGLGFLSALTNGPLESYPTQKEDAILHPFDDWKPTRLRAARRSERLGLAWLTFRAVCYFEEMLGNARCTAGAWS